jgi:gamma-glutamyl:cysteine ligase YbdK (ATP-grasp superfamily)
MKKSKDEEAIKERIQKAVDRVKEGARVEYEALENVVRENQKAEKLLRERKSIQPKK